MTNDSTQWSSLNGMNSDFFDSGAGGAPRWSDPREQNKNTFASNPQFGQGPIFNPAPTPTFFSENSSNAGPSPAVEPSEAAPLVAPIVVAAPLIVAAAPYILFAVGAGLIINELIRTAPAPEKHPGWRW